MWRLWVIAGAICVPLLIIAYVLVTQTVASEADAAYVSGGVAQGTYGQNPGGGGWGRGGYTMMPGPAGSAGSLRPGPASAAPSAANQATGTVTAGTSENWAGYVASGTAGAFTSVSSSFDDFTVTFDNSSTTTGTGGSGGAGGGGAGGGGGGGAGGAGGGQTHHHKHHHDDDSGL
jgi:hypothetical protein